MVKLSKIFSKNENEKHQQNEGKMKINQPSTKLPITYSAKKNKS